jgi:hypothetical protein
MLKFTGTLSRLACCAFALTLSSCVLVASPPTVVKEWVRVVLAPDNSELDQACNRGYLVGSQKNQNKIVSSGLKREVKSSFLYFYATLQNTYTLCYLAGISLNVTNSGESPKEQGKLWIKDLPFDLKDTRVSLEFLNSTGEVIDSTQNLSGKVLNGGKSPQIFSFPSWTSLQIINMKQSSSFAVVIVQGQAEKRIEFRQEDFGGLL